MDWDDIFDDDRFDNDHGINYLLLRKYKEVFMYSLDELHFIMDETSAPYELDENPFSLTENDIAVMKILAEKHQLVIENDDMLNKLIEESH